MRLGGNDFNSEQALIKKARLGDEQAFRLLVQNHEGLVARVVIGMLGDTAQADDVGQEVFISLFKSLHTFKGDSTLKTYLTRIAINLSLNELKKRKRSDLTLVRDTLFAQKVPDERADADQQFINEWVQKAIARLNEEFRAVVVLRMIEGYSTREVSEILGVPLGTVLSRLARAQGKLKVILSEEK